MISGDAPLTSLMIDEVKPIYPELKTPKTHILKGCKKVTFNENVKNDTDTEEEITRSNKLYLYIR